MSETDKYFSPVEWRWVKYGARGKVKRTIKFVNSWLHYEGLSCLSDGAQYHLDLETVPWTEMFPGLIPGSTTPAPVASSLFVRQVAVDKTGIVRKPLPILQVGTPIRRYSFSIGLRREEGFVPISELVEVTLPKSDAPRQYWELFLEQDDEGKFHLAYRTYSNKKYIRIYWDESPAEQLPAPGLTAEQRRMAFRFREIENKEENEELRESTGLEKMEKFTPIKALEYLHLASGNPKILEGGNIFLTIGNQVFIITELLDAYYRIDAPKEKTQNSK